LQCGTFDFLLAKPLPFWMVLELAHCQTDSSRYIYMDAMTVYYNVKALRAAKTIPAPILQ
jgi:hypothetical protein